MSRGPGKLQQAIIRAFELRPSTTISANEFIEICFPQIEHQPKHRIAAVRAARSLAEGSNRFEIFGGAGGLLLVNGTNTRSLAIGRMYDHFAGTRSVSECAAFLNDPMSDAYPEAQPDGFFDLLARRNALWVEWRDEEAEILSARISKRIEQAKRDRSASSSTSSQEDAA